MQAAALCRLGRHHPLKSRGENVLQQHLSDSAGRRGCSGGGWNKEINIQRGVDVMTAPLRLLGGEWPNCSIPKLLAG